MIGKAALSFIQAYKPVTLRLSNHTNAEHFFESWLPVYRQVGPPQRVDCLPQRKISVKCFSQRHIPVWESNQEAATFQSLTFRLPTEP